jgi:uncharacterized membrane protein
VQNDSTEHDPTTTGRDYDILPIRRRDLRRLIEQVDQLAKDRIERNARIADLRAENERLQTALGLLQSVIHSKDD